MCLGEDCGDHVLRDCLCVLEKIVEIILRDCLDVSWRRLWRSYLETAYVSGSPGKMYGDVLTHACLFPRSHWHVLHVSLPVSRLVTCNSNVVLQHHNLLNSVFWTP